jgi:hypothetical protein
MRDWISVHKKLKVPTPKKSSDRLKHLKQKRGSNPWRKKVWSSTLKSENLPIRLEIYYSKEAISKIDARRRMALSEYPRCLSRDSGSGLFPIPDPVPYPRAKKALLLIRICNTGGQDWIWGADKVRTVLLTCIQGADDKLGQTIQTQLKQ